MNTKYLTLFMGLVLAALMAAPAFAEPAEPAVRVISLNAFGTMSPSDADLVKLARMDTSANPELFPSIAGFGIAVTPCPIGPIEGTYVNYPASSTDSVAIGGMIREETPYRFASISAPALSDDYLLAVVKSDGSVLRIGNSEGVTEDGTDLNSTACLLARTGDTILVFAQMGAPQGPTAAGIRNTDHTEGVWDPFNNNEDSGSGVTGGENID
jgi:hypothetical protein